MTLQKMSPFLTVGVQEGEKCKKSALYMHQKSHFSFLTTWEKVSKFAKSTHLGQQERLLAYFGGHIIAGKYFRPP